MFESHPKSHIKAFILLLALLISLPGLLWLQASEFEPLADKQELPEAYIPLAIITLRNGEKIVGELKPENLRFQSNRFGIYSIKTSSIVSFAKDKLSLKDGNVIYGEFVDALNVTTESGHTFSGIKWIDIEELSMKSPEEEVDKKEAVLEAAENKPPPYTPPNYTKIFKDPYKKQGGSYYGSTMTPGFPGTPPQGLSNMIDSKIPILKPGEFEKEYMHDVMPSLPKGMMKPLPPEKKDADAPINYNSYRYSSDDTYSSSTSDNQTNPYDTISPDVNTELTGTEDLEVVEEIGTLVNIDDEITNMTVEQLWNISFEDIF